jgi:hypothetical protein
MFKTYARICIDESDEDEAAAARLIRETAGRKQAVCQAFAFFWQVTKRNNVSLAFTSGFMAGFGDTNTATSVRRRAPCKCHSSMSVFVLCLCTCSGGATLPAVPTAVVTSTGATRSRTQQGVQQRRAGRPPVPGAGPMAFASFADGTATTANGAAIPATSGASVGNLIDFGDDLEPPSRSSASGRARSRSQLPPQHAVELVTLAQHGGSIGWQRRRGSFRTLTLCPPTTKSPKPPTTTSTNNTNAIDLP